MIRARRELWIPFLLFAGTCAAYAPIGANGFVNFDDDLYITDNPAVGAGLSARGVTWAFTTTHASNWHPLTWLSLQLDAQLHGVDAVGYHITNVLLHALNVLLLYAVWRRMTGQSTASAVVAALFALHPLHVESVAWASERKDVLSTCFWLLTMWAYVRYCARPGTGRYLQVVLLFALGLAAKPMLVTLPFVLLLLDWWPLGRLTGMRTRLLQGVKTSERGSLLSRRLLEKVPLFALAVAACALTFYAQEKGRAVNPIADVGLRLRVMNAVVAYLLYIGRMVVPVGLAPFYPHPRAALPGWLVLVAAGALLAFTVFVLRQGRRRPYLVVGWFWYLGTLVPVIGLIQAGWQSSADRYTYVPLIGIFVMAVWTLADWAHGRERRQRALAVTAAASLMVCAVMTWRQVGFWRDSVTLWNRALAVTKDNFVAHLKLGDDFLRHNDLAHAQRQYEETLRLEPNLAYALVNLGSIALVQGRYGEAFDDYQKAVAADPKYLLGQHRLAWMLLLRGDLAGAEQHLQAALQLAPHHPDVLDVLGCLRLCQGRTSEAVAALREAVHLAPQIVAYRCDFAQALAASGAPAAGQREYQQAMRLDHDWPVRAASDAWRFATDPASAERSALRSLQLAQQACQATAPQTPGLFLRALAAAYAESGRFEDAIAAAQEALRRTEDPELSELHAKIQNELAVYQSRRAYRCAAPANAR